MENEIDEISHHLSQVKDVMLNSIEKSHRNAENVKLVIVTKGQPVEKIRAVIKAGAEYLGENYPEETLEKIQALREYPDIKWHMIGHLQSRKIPLVINGFNLIHSIDNPGLAEKLSRRLVEAGKRMPVLLEINVSGEESKNGFRGWNEMDWPGIVDEIQKMVRLPAIDIQGLMTMPPYFVEIEQSRPFFVRLRNLRDYLQNKMESACDLKELSMGTSIDYQVAIEEGATFIRVGQAIMGERNYK